MWPNILEFGHFDIRPFVKKICSGISVANQTKQNKVSKQTNSFQNVLEIHDELAAQIQNSTEAVEYIDGVSSIAEDDDDKSTLASIQGEKAAEDDKEKEEEEVQIDTYRVIGIRRSQGESLVMKISAGAENSQHVLCPYAGFSEQKQGIKAAKSSLFPGNKSLGYI